MKNRPLNASSTGSEIGFRALNKRYHTVTHIIDVLNTNLSVEGKVREMGHVLSDLFQFDRFSLGLLWFNRWYTLDERGMKVVEINRLARTGDNYSAAKWVARTQQALYRRNIPEERCFDSDEELAREGMRSDLVVPLIADGHVVGTFEFISRSEDAYGEADLNTATSIASAVATVVKLFQDQLFLGGIREISEAVQGSLKLDEVLQMVLTHIRSQGYDRVRVYLFDEDARELYCVAQVGGEVKEDFRLLRFSVDDDPYSRATFGARQACIYREGELGRGYRDLVRRVFGEMGYKAKAELPLFVVEDGKDRIVGKITLDNGLSGIPLIPERLDALMLYASQAAIAIRHAQLYLRMEREVELRTEHLRESEERFRLLAKATHEGVLVSSKGIILDINDQGCAVLGYCRDELIGREATLFVAPEFRTIVAKHAATGYAQPYEAELVHKGGKRIPVEIHGRTTHVGGREVRLTTIRDISEHKQMAAERIRLERLNAVGEIARGVAHNFNNILVGVLGYAQLIEMRAEDPDVRSDVLNIIESALRAKELVQHLNQSVNRGSGQLGLLDVNETVRAAIDLTRPRWKDEAELNGTAIEVSLDLEEVAPILGSTDGLRTMVANLIFNAVDAMPNGGVISVQTSMHGERVQVAVRDTGVGMDEETRRRACEPFFTTKHDVGTGLGLSTVYGIVVRWGGRVDIESTPDVGTTVLMYFPAE